MPRRKRNAVNTRAQVSKRGVFSRGVIVTTDLPTWRPDLEAQVEPAGRCGGRPNGKFRYLGEDVADQALKQAQRRRKWQNNPHMETRYYACSMCSVAGEPAAYHLTSKDYGDE
jgi:hypothetical protein